MFLLLCLIYFTQYDSLWVHPSCCKWHNFILFNGCVIFHCISLSISIYHIFFIHSSDDGHLVLPCLGYCKQCCNEHWGACILSGHVFPKYMLRSGLAGSCGSSSFSFLRNLHTVLHSGYTHSEGIVLVLEIPFAVTICNVEQWNSVTVEMSGNQT